MPMLSDLELLQNEMDLLWGPNGPDLVIACARDGQRWARVTKDVPEEAASRIVAEVACADVPAELSAPPPRLERWRTLLEDALGAAIGLAPGSGPSYLIHDDVVFPTGVPLIRSDALNLTDVRGANPGNWGTDEWRDLLGGRLGAWVMAVHEDRVISICHTPVANEGAAEAGVWTHPDFRGHGHAAAATAAWTALMRPTGRLLFYSTSHTNHSSQAVASRLHLRPIGYLWQLRRRPDRVAPIHP
jgi:Acetyltransferase (GNAT) domain